MVIRIFLALLFLVLFGGNVEANSLILDATTKSLELQTSSAASTDYVVSYTDTTTTAFTPGVNQGNIASATTTAILAAPASSTQRQVKWVSVRNRSTTTAQTVTFKLDVSATEYHLKPAITLAAGEGLEIDADGTLTIFTASGLKKTQAQDTAAYNGKSFGFQKAGTAKDSAGYRIAFAKDAGFPGAYNLGAPGLAGFNTDCGTVSNATNPVGAAQAGAHYLPDPSSGNYYLTDVAISNSVAELVQLIDVLWYNTGIVVTTTTAQTVTMPGALPARDINGSTDGEGVQAALLTTTANTNAATIANTTISYTDSEGNAGNTGTFSAVVGWQAPATPVIGTWMPFQLAAGDRGIRSVQSITLGTSYGAGALSLVLYRPLVSVPNPVASVGGIMSRNQGYMTPGVRIYNDTCIWALAVGSASAGNLAGTYSIAER